MAITALRSVGRQRVAWYRTMPAEVESAPFVERQFLAKNENCDDAKLQDPIYLSGLAAVIFNQRQEKPYQIGHVLGMHARRLLNYDCHVIIRPAANRFSILQQVLGGLELPTAGLHLAKSGTPPLPHLRLFSLDVPWTDIANFVLMYPPGPAPAPVQNLTILPPCVQSKLSGPREILLRRAFSDCGEIHLISMKGGRSAGVAVYRAHAQLRGGLEGEWPQPFFVKFGPRRKIFGEYMNYEWRVDPYIPFHLGPQLVRDRCCLGAYEGVIVGDYVDESECLTDCACQGRATAAISCLFDKTLAGWHRRAKPEDARPISRLLARLFPPTMPPARFARARELGATLTLSQLRRLFDRCTSTPVLVGPIHGDLHARNVRVRATDAIVIDFVSHRNSPLLADAASLEASLLVDGFEKDERKPIEWLASIEALYRNSPSKQATPHGNPKDASSWFYSCVAQIRRYARQWECQDYQYAAALGAALLRKAMKDPYAEEWKASRHAAAYIFAERILVAAFGEASAAPVENAAPDAPAQAQGLPGGNAAAPADDPPQGPE
jgi:hypothetical protein